MINEPILFTFCCVNQDGKEVDTGEIGIIELKGDNVFGGYWGNPDKTSESFRQDGYFITGDMARIDENGYVIIATVY